MKYNDTKLVCCGCGIWAESRGRTRRCAAGSVGREVYQEVKVYSDAVLTCGNRWAAAAPNSPGCAATFISLTYEMSRVHFLNPHTNSRLLTLVPKRNVIEPSTRGNITIKHNYMTYTIFKLSKLKYRVGYINNLFTSILLSRSSVLRHRCYKHSTSADDVVPLLRLTSVHAIFLSFITNSNNVVNNSSSLQLISPSFVGL